MPYFFYQPLLINFILKIPVIVIMLLNLRLYHLKPYANDSIK